MKELVLILIFAAFSISGLYAANKEKKRLDLLSEVVRLIGYMGSEIDLYRRELTDIYISFESPLLDRSGFSQALGQYGFERAAKTLSLDAESKRLLCDLGSTLGMLPVNEQNAKIKSCLRGLESILDTSRQEYPKKRKLYISFGLMLGAIIVIIGI